MSGDNRISKVTLDEAMSIARSPEAEHERAIAMADLVEDNRITLKSGVAGPYLMHIFAAEQRLFFDLSPQSGGQGTRLVVAISPLNSVIRDYFTMCESYFEAIKHATPARIEAIDLGRRGVHNEGSLMLLEQIEGLVNTDLETARRLFTLICVLRMK